VYFSLILSITVQYQTSVKRTTKPWSSAMTGSVTVPDLKTMVNSGFTQQAIIWFTFNEPAGKVDSASMNVFSIARSEKALPKSSASW